MRRSEITGRTRVRAQSAQRRAATCPVQAVSSGSKRHGTRAHRFDPFTFVEGRRQRAWAATARLVLQSAEKMRRGALRSALSERVREGNVVVIDDFKLDQPKTKGFLSTLGTLGLEGKTLIVDSLENDNLMLASRNVQRTKIVHSYGLNIYDLLYHEKLVLSRRAAEELTQMLDPQSRKAGAGSGVIEGNANEEAA
jgi:large subunit ribosomal protein L4